MDIQTAKHSKNSRPAHARGWRTVIIAGTSAFCVFLCAAGFMWANYNTTRIGDGRASLRADFYVEGGQAVFELSGSRTVLTVPSAVSDFLKYAPKILPPGYGLAFYLVQFGKKTVEFLCNQEVIYEESKN